MSKRAKTYGLSEVRPVGGLRAPALPYQPPKPRRYAPRIALIGCGGISAFHLRNYRAMGLDVAMLCSRNRAHVEARGAEFFPEAAITTDLRHVLRSEDIELVDITTHPAERVALIRAALEAGKHVLSQKPFVLDLDTGTRLADLADARGLLLAVNQNGRWAPHWSYLTQLIRRGTLGEIASIDFTVAWDHSWVVTTPFNTLHHLLLYDFAVHWFDIATVLLGGRRARSVFATVAAAPGQTIAPPALASVVADYGDVQVRWSFNAANRFAQCDRTLICGSKGTALSAGPSLSEQSVSFTTARGTASPKLEGTWFESGFQGAMGELLCAIEQRREPLHSARNNLATLELAFAALASAERGEPAVPGSVRRLSGKLLAKCRPK
jgi:predicted dehydrogenase